MMLLLLWAARRRRFDARSAARRRGVVRVLFYCATVGVVLGLLSARAGVTHASEASMALGRELSALTGVAGETTRIVLNGERLAIGRATSGDDVEHALDAFVARTCPARGVGLFRRVSSGDEGVAFCLRRLSESPDVAAAALARFAETGDLADLGGLDYAYARREDDGTTSLLVAWSEGSFRPGRVAWSGDGDAPGTDSAIIPRPVGGRRTLSARIEGAPYALRLYEVSDAAAALAAYDREMPALGWARIDDTPDARVFAKGDVHVLVAQSRAPDGKTVLTIGETAPAAAGLDARNHAWQPPR